MRHAPTGWSRAARQGLVGWLVSIVILSAGLVIVPAASALPTPTRPGLTEDGGSDEVVVAPGEADATGRIPRRLGEGGAAKGRAGVPGPDGGQLGSRSVVVLRVDYAGDPVDPKAAGQPYTEAEIRSRLTGAALSASSLFSAQSAGAVSLTGLSDAGGDVSPWITLGGTPPVKAGSSPSTCDHAKIAKDAFAKANASFGIDVTRYDHVVIVFADYADDPAVAGDQSSPCGWSGLGEVPGSTTWINGLYAGQDDLDAAVIAHELGHNLGAAHAATVACTEPSGATIALRTSCALGGAVEYGDPFDLMGGGWPIDAPNSPWLGSVLMSAWHRAQLLELPDAAQQTITTNGTYELGDARTGAGIRLLRIGRGTGTSAVRELVIERRVGGVDFDRWTGFSPVVPDGILIRLAPVLSISERSILLDMHPSTPTNKDAPLAVGET
ncbi:MAG: hypothetical protein Q7T55_01620, partial [Solirubrobacteraceae bacterium]|nr:hypothetical protein [Solirubrobacteraceae bacterium]